jgi:cytochrome b561
MFKNSASHYGLVSILLHWLAAASVFGLFGLGFWMVDLSYYSSWYRTAPDWHKSIGILLALLMIIRLCWRVITPPPAAIGLHKPWEKKLSLVVQTLLYLSIITLVVSGYLISTEDGRSIAVFDWFAVPALGQLFSRQADIAGLIHKYVAYSVIALSVLHAIGALKHHYIDKDATLKRMFGHKPKI